MLPGMDEAEEPWREIKHRTTKFSMQALFGLWQRCGNRDEAGGNMTLSRFQTFFRDEFGCTPAMRPLVSRVFTLLDTDGTGSLDWKEIFFGLSMVVGRSVEDRAAFFFKLYDADNSGTVSRDEIMEAVIATQPANADADAIQRKALRIMAHFDADGDDNVTLDEFTATCIRDPSLLECFGSLFGSHELTKDAFSKRTNKRRSTRARAGSTAGLVEKAAEIQQEAIGHIKELRNDAMAHMRNLHASMLETQSQLHGLGIVGSFKISRRRSTGGALPEPQDSRNARRSSLPERIIATAAMRAAQLATLEAATRQGGTPVTAADIMEQRRQMAQKVREQQEAGRKAQQAAEAEARAKAKARRDAARQAAKEERAAARRAEFKKLETFRQLMEAGITQDAGQQQREGERRSLRSGLSFYEDPKTKSRAAPKRLAAFPENGMDEAKVRATDDADMDIGIDGRTATGDVHALVPGVASSRRPLMHSSATNNLRSPSFARNGSQHARGTEVSTGPWQATSRGATPMFRARASSPPSPPKVPPAGDAPQLHPNQWWRWFSYDSDIDIRGRAKRRARLRNRRQAKRGLHSIHPRDQARPAVRTLPMAGSRLGSTSYQLPRSPLAASQLSRSTSALPPDAAAGTTGSTSVRQRARRRVATKPSSMSTRMPSIRRGGAPRSPSPKRATRSLHFEPVVNVHRIRHLPAIASPSTGLDMCIGPDHGTVHRHMAPLLSVSPSPGHELASPYTIGMKPGEALPPSMQRSF